MTISRRFVPLPALAALAALLAAPARAATLTYTFTGVTFTDGATASGFFNLDPGTHAFGSFDITTTNGITDTTLGSHYTSANATPWDPFANTYFSFTVANPGGQLILNTMTADSVGVSPLFPGGSNAPNTLGGSGEFARNSSGTRGLAPGGSLVITNPALNAVPEPSSVTAFAFMGVGAAGLMWKARKRRAG